MGFTEDAIDFLALPRNLLMKEEMQYREAPDRLTIQEL